MNPWGIHLLVDISGANDVIRSEDQIEQFFNDLISTLKMYRLGPFVIRRVDDPCNKGWSAFQMITTSHLAIHCDELKDTLYVDVFSCKHFDVDVVLDLIARTFQPRLWNFRVIKRVEPSV